MLDKMKYVREDSKKKFCIKVEYNGEVYYSTPLEGIATQFADKFYDIIGKADSFHMTLEDMSFFVIGKDAVAKAVFIFKQLGE